MRNDDVQCSDTLTFTVIADSMLQAMLANLTKCVMFIKYGFSGVITMNASHRTVLIGKGTGRGIAFD